jgi:hypothetical protein
VPCPATFSKQLYLSEYITWRCKEHEQEGENRGVTAPGFIFFATNNQNKKIGVDEASVE